MNHSRSKCSTWRCLMKSTRNIWIGLAQTAWLKKSKICLWLTKMETVFGNIKGGVEVEHLTETRHRLVETICSLKFKVREKIQVENLEHCWRQQVKEAQMNWKFKCKRRFQSVGYSISINRKPMRKLNLIRFLRKTVLSTILKIWMLLVCKRQQRKKNMLNMIRANKDRNK